MTSMYVWCRSTPQFLKPQTCWDQVIVFSFWKLNLLYYFLLWSVLLLFLVLGTLFSPQLQSHLQPVSPADLCSKDQVIRQNKETLSQKFGEPYFGNCNLIKIVTVSEIKISLSLILGDTRKTVWMHTQNDVDKWQIYLQRIAYNLW